MIKDLGSSAGIEIPMSDIDDFDKIEKNSLLIKYNNQDD